VKEVWKYVLGGGPDSPEKEKRPKTVRPRAGQTISAVGLEAGAVWVWTHYLHGRTKPCLQEFCVCRKVDSPLESRWQGFILADHWGYNKVVLLGLTENVMDTCPELREGKLDLRGAMIDLTRPAGKRNGIVTAVVKPDFRRSWKTIVMPYTTRDCLEKMFWRSKRDPEGMAEYQAIVAKLSPDLHAEDAPSSRDPKQEESA